MELQQPIKHNLPNLGQINTLMSPLQVVTVSFHDMYQAQAMHLMHSLRYFIWTGQSHQDMALYRYTPNIKVVHTSRYVVGWRLICLQQICDNIILCNIMEMTTILKKYIIATQIFRYLYRTHRLPWDRCIHLLKYYHCLMVVVWNWLTLHLQWLSYIQRDLSSVINLCSQTWFWPVSNIEPVYIHLNW